MAERDGEVLGVYRPAREHGVRVLRGMRVRARLRRQGIGNRLLGALRVLDERCYCVAHAHLERFYGRGGFGSVEEAKVPAFLFARLTAYRAQGLVVVVLMREPSRTDARHGDS